MWFQVPRKVGYRELLAILTVVSFLASCNMSITSSSTATGSNKAVTTTASTSTTMPRVNTGSVALDADNLHIQTNNVIACPTGSHLSPPNHLVLATDRSTYDSSELQQITNYVDELLQTDETTGSVANISAPLPPTLAWTSGGVYDKYGSCLTTLDLTNTGNTTIQVPQVDVRLLAAPRQNTYRYRLIDACSLALKGPCRCNQCGGAGGSCSLYYANIQLGMGQQDSLFSATPSSGDPSCGEMTLQPGSTLTLLLDFQASPPRSLIYSLTTELSLQTANGKQTLALPQLGTSVAFANSSQLSCYALQGQTFVQKDFSRSDTHTNCI